MIKAQENTTAGNLTTSKYFKIRESAEIIEPNKKVVTFQKQLQAKKLESLNFIYFIRPIFTADNLEVSQK